MVASKRGRGAKGQAPKTRAAAQASEEQLLDQAEGSEQIAETAEDNGEAAEQLQEIEEAALLEGDDENQGEAGNAEVGESSEAKPEERKEEKIESGKLLVENLPSSYLFDYQEKLKELFSKHGEVTTVKRGPIIVTELTTTPTLSAIVEFKNKDSLDKALTEEGTLLDGSRISLTIESRADTAVLVGVPYEANTEYVRLLFGECGDIQQIQEFSKTKYKILRVTFHAKESVEKALKLDRELRINGFLVTVSKYRDEEEQKAHSANLNKQNKRQHSQNQNRNSNINLSQNNQQNRSNNFRGGRGGVFNARGNFRGGRGRGYAGRGGAFPRGGGGGGGVGGGGYAGGINNFLPPAAYMGRPGGYMNDGQRPNKRLRQM